MENINNTIEDKNNLSTRVKKILHEKGFSFLFNWQDYNRYKSQCQRAYNKAYSIADKFLSEAEQESDYSNYIF